MITKCNANEIFIIPKLGFWQVAASKSNKPLEIKTSNKTYGFYDDLPRPVFVIPDPELIDIGDTITCDVDFAVRYL